MIVLYSYTRRGREGAWDSILVCFHSQFLSLSRSLSTEDGSKRDLGWDPRSSSETVNLFNLLFVCSVLGLSPMMPNPGSAFPTELKVM